MAVVVTGMYTYHRSKEHWHVPRQVLPLPAARMTARQMARQGAQQAERDAAAASACLGWRRLAAHVDEGEH